MPEEVRKDFFLEFFSTFNEYFIITIPAEVVIILLFLYKKVKYFKNVIKFKDKLGNVSLAVLELRKKLRHDVRSSCF